MARLLAQRTGRDDVTAMPLGLDAPTAIGMALLVLGPAFVGFKAQGMGEHAAAIATWQLGMAALVVMGVLKLVLAFFGDAVTRRSEEHTSELQSLMRISYAVFCLKNKTKNNTTEMKSEKI